MSTTQTLEDLATDVTVAPAPADAPNASPTEVAAGPVETTVVAATDAPISAPIELAVGPVVTGDDGALRWSHPA